jgi:ABC-2 type transport system ATP-binding protein
MASSITVRDEPGRARAQSRRTGAQSGPVVIEVRNVSKTFRVPDQRVDTLKERVVRPLHRTRFRELKALNDISFDVHKGEFFGIVGRNGSGKSSLLKILASIYGTDRGRVRVAGRMAPFIELGVGFNPEMTARENVVLNAVLFGLPVRKARTILDAVMEFAELEAFVDMKLKNYSSGMMVRLAFAIMVHADSDIMLIDEVLAVGDAAFAQKCMNVFYERRRAGRTIVLVTHDMAIVQSMCHRALVLHDGEQVFLGDPEDAALRYFRLNFAHESAEDGESVQAPFDDSVSVALNGRVVRAQLLGSSGEPIVNLEQGEPIILDVVIEAARPLVDPTFLLHLLNADGVVVLGLTRTLKREVAEGERVVLAGEIENLLVPGQYSLDCWIRRDREFGDMAVQGMRLAQFVVYGTAPRHGVITVRSGVELELER